MAVLKKPSFCKAHGKYFRITSAGLYMYKGIFIEVPVGFPTDFASIPRPFRNLISVTGKHVEAAVLHDWLYYNAGSVPTTSVLSGKFEYDRRWADDAFLNEMKNLGVGWLQRTLMYRAVRLAGWTHVKWKSLRKSSEPRKDSSPKASPAIPPDVPKDPRTK